MDRWTTRQLDAVRVAQAQAAADPARALNVFQRGSGGSPELLAALIEESTVSRYSSAGAEAAASVRGPLLALQRLGRYLQRPIRPRVESRRAQCRTCKSRSTIGVSAWTTGSWSCVDLKLSHGFSTGIGRFTTGLSATWVGGAVLRDLEIAAGLLNALDQAPPFAEVGSVAGYDLSQGDLRQRCGYLELSKRF